MFLFVWPVSGYGQGVYLYPSLGTLRLDIDPSPFFDAEVDEGISLGVGIGYHLSERVAIEARYLSTGFEIRGEVFESIPGRFHHIGSGVRLALLVTTPLELRISLLPGLLIGTIQGIDDSVENFAAPLGLDLVTPLSGRIRLRAGLQDLLHRCEAPSRFEGTVCEDGEWLHHLTTSVGAEFSF